jgi:hypothetical protein
MVMAKIKVSQATIDKIKTMGMTKALKGASGASPEMKEALTRMYGARRVSAAMPSKPKATSADAARSAATAGAKYKSADSARRSVTPAKPVAKSADAARLSVTKASVKMPGKGPMAKKSGTTDPFAKAVFSVGKALSGGDRMTAAQVAAENKRRAAAVAAAKAKKNK